jgi:hypothetical protein
MNSMIMEDGDNGGNVYNENWQVKFLDNTNVFNPDRTPTISLPESPNPSDPPAQVPLFSCGFLNQYFHNANKALLMTGLSIGGGAGTPEFNNSKSN